MKSFVFKVTCSSSSSPESTSSFFGIISDVSREDAKTNLKEHIIDDSDGEISNLELAFVAEVSDNDYAYLYMDDTEPRSIGRSFKKLNRNRKLPLRQISQEVQNVLASYRKEEGTATNGADIATEHMQILQSVTPASVRIIAIWGCGSCGDDVNRGNAVLLYDDEFGDEWYECWPC